MLTDSEAMDDNVISVGEPRAVEVAVGRFACEYDGSVGDYVPAILEHESDAVINVGAYVLFVGIVFIPLLFSFGEHTCDGHSENGRYWLNVGNAGFSEE